MRRIVVVLGLGLLPACLLPNPDYEHGASAGQDGGASTTSGSSTSGTPTTSGAPTGSGSASEGSSGAGSLSDGVSATGTGSTSGDMTSGTSGGGSSGGSSGSTGPDLISCSPADQIAVELPVRRDAYFVSSDEMNCGWKDSDGNVLNSAIACAVQNYGKTPYAVIGKTMVGRAQYVLDFNLKKALEMYPGMLIMSAQLEIVAWWSTDRTDVVFDVGALTPADPWFEGGKDHALAKDNDSSWQYRQIIGPMEKTKLPWSGGDGPASSAVPVGTIDAPFIKAYDHPVFLSSALLGPPLNAWLADPDPNVGGFVITTDAEPLLVKNLDQGTAEYRPKLHLVLCPG